jgi:hypothetical protein
VVPHRIALKHSKPFDAAAPSMGMWTTSLAEPQRDTTAAELRPIYFEILRRLAAAKIARELSGDTFQATGPVHEAWLRQNGKESPRF